MDPEAVAGQGLVINGAQELPAGPSVNPLGARLWDGLKVSMTGVGCILERQRHVGDLELCYLPTIVGGFQYFNNLCGYALTK